MSRCLPAFKMCDVRRNMLRQLRLLMVRNRIFGDGHHIGFDQFRSSLQISQDGESRLLVPAPGRDFTNDSLPVAELGCPRSGGRLDAVGPFFPVVTGVVRDFPRPSFQ